MKKTIFTFLALCWIFCLPLWGSASDGPAQRNDDNGWTILAAYPVNPSAGGLASDGEYIYIGSYGGGHGSKVYRFDPATEINELLFEGPQSNVYGLTFDGEYLWTIDREFPSTTPAFAMQLDLDGNEISQFDLPNFYMSGIAWDDGNFWVATYSPNPGTIHYIDGQGNEISSFTPPTDQPWDLALQGDSLWIADFWNDYIHLVETDGTLIQSFPYDDHRATGIYHDGTFLWYLGKDSQNNSTLYKVDPWGTGTPVIQVPFSHNFGNVTIGNSETWEMNIFNEGTGDLIIEDITFTEGNEAFSVDVEFPFTIEPETFTPVTVTFAPEEIAIFEKTLTVHSNDPQNLQVEVAIAGNGLAPGAYLVTDQELIDFGPVRIHSSSRLYMEVKNMGDEQLSFESISFSNDYFYWDESVEFPLNLNPVQAKELPLWFKPHLEGVIEGEATLVFNNEDQSPYSIFVRGLSEDENHPIGTVLWDKTLEGSTFNNPRAIMPVPDVTGDGIADVIVCTRGLQIKLFNGNSSGTPDLIWETEVGTVEYPKGIALMDDINEDGYKDFVIGTAYGDRAVTAMSSKTGEIIWRYETNEYGGGGWVYMVDVRFDFNDNGYMDVLAAAGDDGDGTGPRRVFLLNGKTGEKIWDTPMGGAAFSVLAVEDFTGDGVPDVIGGGSTPGQQGRVIGINGANGNIEWDFTTSGTSVWALEQIDDITDNGIKDVIAGSFNGFYYLLDATNGNVEHSGNLGNALILDFWQAGDLNGDGYTDILPAYSSIPNAVAISGKDGAIIWSASVADQPWSVTPLRDIDGDGVNDLAVGTLFNNNFVYFLSGADGTILETVAMPAAVDAIRGIPDITGDNSMEVVAAGRNNYLVAFSGGTAVAPDYYDVTFVVTDNEAPANPIEGARITIVQTNHFFVTEENGEVVANMAEGSYNFTVTKSGYAPFDGTFELVDEDKTIEVVLYPDDYYEVTFLVTDDADPANPLENAEIEITETGQSHFTDADGMALILFGEGSYTYTVSKEGYFPEEGSFVVDGSDKTIEVVMQLDDTGLPFIGGPQVVDAYSYPNPFSEHTNIYFTLTKETTVSVYVYDMRARKFNIIEPRLFPAGENSVRWDGNGPEGTPLMDGLYFFEVRAGENIYRNKMLILRN